MEWVKNIVIICAVGAVAASFAPSAGRRGVKALSVLLVVLTAVTPIARFSMNNNDVFNINGKSGGTVTDARSYDDAVLEQTAAIIASYVRDTLDEKYGVREDVGISVFFDDSSDSPTLTEIQIFCGVRFDSYRDREIEDEMSRYLGCDVFIFSD